MILAGAGVVVVQRFAFTCFRLIPNMLLNVVWQLFAPAHSIVSGSVAMVDILPPQIQLSAFPDPSIFAQ
jgi:hypothetical protein